jgi:hypothetical protein
LIFLNHTCEKSKHFQNKKRLSYEKIFFYIERFLGHYRSDFACMNDIPAFIREKLPDNQ